MRTHLSSRPFILFSVVTASSFVGTLAFASQSAESTSVDAPSSEAASASVSSEPDDTSPSTAGSEMGGATTLSGSGTAGTTSVSTATAEPDTYNTAPEPEPMPADNNDFSTGTVATDYGNDYAEDKRRDYLRFRVDMVPLSYSYGVDWDDNDLDSHSVSLLGGLPIQSRGTLRSGLGPTSGLGFGVGYLWDNRVAFGARLGLGYRYLAGDGDLPTSHVVTYSVAPEFEYYFRSEEDVNPLIAVRAGFVGSYQRVDGDGAEDVDLNRVGPIVGVGTGVSWWASDQFAFDLRLMLDYSPIWSSGTEGDVTDSDEYDGHSHNLAVSLVTGFSFGIPTNRDRHEHRRNDAN